MKINQLFVKQVDLDMLNLVIECFGLAGISDLRMFSKADMTLQNTTTKMSDLVPRLQEYYLPCKAKLYLQNVTQKKCITILKQILKLHDHVLLSKERNSRHRKIILYQIVSEKERKCTTGIEVRHDEPVLLSFAQ